MVKRRRVAAKRVKKRGRRGRDSEIENRITSVRIWGIEKENRVTHCLRN